MPESGFPRSGRRHRPLVRLDDAANRAWRAIEAEWHPLCRLEASLSLDGQLAAVLPGGIDE